jgi:hypothetical protein
VSIRTLFFLLLLSCASVKGNKPYNTKGLFKQKDQSGEFLLTREAGLSPNKREFIVKGQLEADKQLVEKLISISDIEKKLLEPKVSQFSVWINKKKNFSEISRDKAGNQLILRLISPDPKNDGIKFYPLPEESKNLCFFSQVIECARFDGFLVQKIKEKETYKLNVIWDGYPFFHQLLENFPPKLLSPATLEFDGKNGLGNRRFVLKVEGEEIIFELDSQDKILKRIWISKGVTIEKINDSL